MDINQSLNVYASGLYDEYVVLPVNTKKKSSLIYGWPQLEETPEDICTYLEKGAGLAMLLGPASNLGVIDVDRKNGIDGVKSLEKALGHSLADDPFFNSSACVKTPSGGFHFYFEYQENLPRRIGFLQGVDLLATNSYCLLPPSCTNTGEYQFLPEKSLFEVDPMPFPTALLPLLKTSSISVSRKENWRKEHNNLDNLKVKAGMRNERMTSLYGFLLRNSSPLFAIGIAEHLNMSCFDPPLSKKELVKIIDSINKRELEK